MMSLFQPGQDHRLHDAVDVFLGELGKDGSGGSGLTDESLQISYPFFTEAFCDNRDLNSLSHRFTRAHYRPLLFAVVSLAGAATSSL
jgi:hypothetical protein